MFSRVLVKVARPFDFFNIFFCNTVQLAVSCCKKPVQGRNKHSHLNVDIPWDREQLKNYSCATKVIMWSELQLVVSGLPKSSL